MDRMTQTITDLFDSERVRICSSFPRGVSDLEFARLPLLEQKRWDWHPIPRAVCELTERVTELSFNRQDSGL